MKSTIVILMLIVGSFAQIFACSSHGTRTQAELDALSVCTVMTGDLIIETNSSLSDPITNLDALSNLTEVGNIIIRNNPHLRDISGLNNLITVRGSLEIQNNPLLAECCALDNLFSVGSIGGEIIMMGNSTSGVCNDNGTSVSPCTIVPTLNQWGIIIMFLILLIAGALTINFKNTVLSGHR